MRGRLAAALFCVVLAAPVLAEEIPALRPVPEEQNYKREDYMARRARLVAERDALKQAFSDHNSACDAVERGSARDRTCVARQEELGSALARHVDASRAFNAELSEIGRYRPSGNALIGGMIWITGYNVQSTDPALRDKAAAMLKEQMRLAGIPYSEGVDFARYNFVLGIAAKTTVLGDLGRAFLDNVSTGQYSHDHRDLYASVKGRSFGQLACHSNGAMVCLAALRNRDAIADRVVLYGPQITPASLQQWDELVRSGRVTSVRLVINRGDPVPPAAMLFGGTNPVGAGDAFFDPAVLARRINRMASRLVVETHACGNGTPSMECHDAAQYKAIDCRRASSGQPVPGTALPGRGSVTEPPPPC